MISESTLTRTLLLVLLNENAHLQFSFTFSHLIALRFIKLKLQPPFVLPSIVHIFWNRVPSKPSIVFSSQNTFYSQSSYSSWWSGFVCLFVCLFCLFQAIELLVSLDVKKNKGVVETASNFVFGSGGTFLLSFFLSFFLSLLCVCLLHTSNREALKCYSQHSPRVSFWWGSGSTGGGWGWGTRGNNTKELTYWFCSADSPR